MNYGSDQLILTVLYSCETCHLSGTDAKSTNSAFNIASVYPHLCEWTHVGFCSGKMVSKSIG